jgi:hypothetical protein
MSVLNNKNITCSKSSRILNSHRVLVKNDEAIVRVAMETYPESIRFTSEKFQADYHALVLNAVMRDYRILHDFNPMYKQLIPPEQRTLEQKRLLREKGSVTKAMRKVGYHPIVSHKIQQMLGTNQ